MAYSARSLLALYVERHYLWRAGDQDGHVQDILGQCHRDTLAAKRFFRKLLTGFTSVPSVIITHTLKSYEAATVPSRVPINFPLALPLRKLRPCWKWQQRACLA